jgi:MFS family permease
VLNLLAFAPFFILGPTLFASVPKGARTWGIIASATGAGGILGGLLAMHVEVPRPILVIQIAIALLATLLVVLAIHASVPLLVFGSGVFGVALAVANIFIQTTLQETIPNYVLSRVTSIYSLASMGLGLIGFALSGYAAGFFGAEKVLTIGACSVVASVALVLTSSHVCTSDVINWESKRRGAGASATSTIALSYLGPGPRPTRWRRPSEPAASTEPTPSCSLEPSCHAPPASA